MFWVVTARLAGAVVALIIGIFMHRMLHKRKIAAELHIHGIHGIYEDRFVKTRGIQQVGAATSSRPGIHGRLPAR
jgi:hypothetical protein